MPITHWGPSLVTIYAKKDFTQDNAENVGDKDEGFRKQRGCVDQINAHKILVESS